MTPAGRIAACGSSSSGRHQRQVVQRRLLGGNAGRGRHQPEQDQGDLPAIDHLGRLRQNISTFLSRGCGFIVTVGFLTWRFFTRGERRAGKAAEDFGRAFDLT